MTVFQGAWNTWWPDRCSGAFCHPIRRRSACGIEAADLILLCCCRLTGNAASRWLFRPVQIFSRIEISIATRSNWCARWSSSRRSGPIESPDCWLTHFCKVTSNCVAATIAHTQHRWDVSRHPIFFEYRYYFKVMIKSISILIASRRRYDFLNMTHFSPFQIGTNLTLIQHFFS